MVSGRPKQAVACRTAVPLRISSPILAWPSRSGLPPFVVQVPNASTIEAMKELDEGKGKRFDTVEELFRDLDI